MWLWCMCVCDICLIQEVHVGCVCVVYMECPWCKYCACVYFWSMYGACYCVCKLCVFVFLFHVLSVFSISDMICVCVLVYVV